LRNHKRRYLIRRYLIMRKHGSIKLAAAVFMAISIALFLPYLGIAGSLEPSGPPGPTMKTLDQIPPTWSIKLPAAERFVVLADFNNEAVLDKETGLVWEKSPSTGLKGQFDAYVRCNTLTTGSRLGWRIPTLQEISSLIDPTQTNPALPQGHPFSNVLYDVPYWTASTDIYFYDSNGLRTITSAWFLGFASGWASYQDLQGRTGYVWCVRGEHGIDLLVR
jgi:hypothetical protein